MNSGKASGARYHSRLSRRLLLRFVLALVGWLVGFTGLCLLAMMACNTIIWQPWDPVYQFLQFVKDFLPVFYFVPLLGGWLAISYYFLGRPLRYLDEIVAAAKLLAQPRDEMVRLPGELKDIEDDMNLAKQRTLLFKLCVEVNMMSHTVAAHFRADPVNRRELRAYAVDEVLRTNGKISFDDALDLQRQVYPDG